MLPLDKVQCEQFAACLNQDFQIAFPDGALTVQLSEARPLQAKGQARRACSLFLNPAKAMR